MNKIIKNTIILTIITLVSGVALGAVYEITKAPIANAQERQSRKHTNRYSRMRIPLMPWR